MKVTIRKMDLSDIPFVYQEERRIFGKSLGEKTLYNEILYNEMSRYFIALIDDQRVGYIGSWLTRPNAEILNLFVLESHRGEGIGTMLVNQVVHVCEEEQIEHLTLEVRISNHGAIGLYEALGFDRIAIRKQYYEDGEDACLMVRPIGGTS
jgi:ribosomal-protein-alanine N-acetyltransferase